MQAHQGKKDVYRVHQNDLNWEKQRSQKIPKKFIQSRDERQQKKKKTAQANNPKGQFRQKLRPKKKKKPTRLKTQKGSLGKS